MNEHLLERFGRSRRPARQEKAQADVWLLPAKLNVRIREYFEAGGRSENSAAWQLLPEFPTSAEVLDVDTDGSVVSDVVEIAPNRPEGAWSSKDAYLGAQYELLREDAVRPLREAVAAVRMNPTANEDAFNGTIGIYEKVHINAITCSARGLAVHVSFSLIRAGKKILWEQSKRLITGSLVVLTPVADTFKTKAVVATVAARPLAALAQNPPEIDLFFARPDEFEIDPAHEWLMVEERSGYYEADRSTLLALQKMMSEPFPLSEHLVKVESHVEPPAYLQDQPLRDMSKVLTGTKHESYENVNILKNWPAQPQSDLDGSQLAALKRILSKRLAVIQGPPGTGKTHVSVQALLCMLANKRADDPPILVTCQTNHALDQLLRHVAALGFADDFVRLGGRSKDRDIIKKRTLYEVRQLTSEPPLAGGYKGQAQKRMKALEKEIGNILLPLKPDKHPINLDILIALDLITATQAKSLQDGASKWTQQYLSNPNEAKVPLQMWLGKALKIVPLKQQDEELGFDFEEADLEFEQLKEIEAENFAKDDEDIETLQGTMLPLADNVTGIKAQGMTTAKVQTILKEQDMWKIPEHVRGSVYAYLQTEVKKALVEKVREKAKVYQQQVIKRRIGLWEQDETILKNQKIIGLTTTAFSKYRALIAGLQPTIVLIEEAGETLEAPVTATCVPSLQHLILVGDHRQLRPHCHVRAHENKPFHLNVSLFERMVNNKIEFDTLTKQRRMVPEIRRLLYPIYGNIIKDHASVLNPANRPDVPGMGGVNSFFFTHSWPEHRDEQMSAVNWEEADMIVGFVEYLVFNGMQTDDITVLTFYNGQRKRLLTELRNRISLSGRRFNVVTVDSYQGEENKVVLLSLVRSNDKHQIGFLGVENRVCVALSRAQCGFYIFGDGLCMYQNKLWEHVINILAGKENKKDRPTVPPVCRLDEQLPVCCSKHNSITSIRSPSDFDQKINGGCELKCGGVLLCGHPCELKCHPFPHDLITCNRFCQKPLSCGHQCSGTCGDVPCSCTICKKSKVVTKATTAANSAFDGREVLSQHGSHSSTSESWQSFAEAEAVHYKSSTSTLLPHRTSQQNVTSATTCLIDIDADRLPDRLKNGLACNDTTSPMRTDDEGELTTVKVLKDGRKKWKMEDSVGVAEKNTELIKDWSKEESLIDLL